MIYDVYLQVKRTGRTHAHVPDLPGYNWLADTPVAAWN
jgi:predicted RNase H-like HicB family nuclease